jgi:glycine dehydrogenase subunit 2
MRAFWGNFGMMTRAYTYIRVHGEEGLRANSMHAVLNANYVQARLKGTYPVPQGHRWCMHETILQGKFEKNPDIKALDVSKRLMDKGFHPPTNYFPLIVPEALMIEPTETEDKATLDRFCDAMIEIAEEAVEQPDLLKNAPWSTPLRRMDEVKAAKDLVLCCRVPEPA